MALRRFSAEAVVLALLYSGLFTALVFAIQQFTPHTLWPVLMFVILFSTMYGRLLDVPE